ncbi:TIGR03943 family protein [Microbispora sp. NPDC046933]|uniref:TIGR03943 family putative permease subunit n=1 Tax=Microbispora sp. NPDC046933 TaxID=3155618 RepID=UPI0033C5C556
MSQSLVLTLLGGVVLWISALTTSYLNYVKPGFRPFLLAAGAVVLALGITGLVQEWRRPYAGAHAGHVREGTGEHAEGHDHSRAPKVGWLLCLPVFAIALIAPPALGAFAARTEDGPARPPATAGSYVPLSGEKIIPMAVGEFIGRAWDFRERTLTGRKVRLTGFVVRSKRKDRWYVTRMQMSCCAADAIALKVAVLGAAPPPDDTWVEVTGAWVPPRSREIPNGTVPHETTTGPPEMTAVQVTEIPQPSEPYE